MKVKTTRKTFALTAVAMVVSVSAGVLAPLPEAKAASATIFEVDPSLQSRIAREKVKQRGPRRGSRPGGARGNSDNCGQVDIGNNNNNRNARSRTNPRVNITVVQGPVINAARCR